MASINVLMDYSEKVHHLTIVLNNPNVVGLNVLTPLGKNLNKYIPMLAPGETAHG